MAGIRAIPLLILTQLVLAESFSPICTMCKCSIVKEVEADCPNLNDLVFQIMYNSTFYFNAAANTTYNIRKLSFSNNLLVHINESFPRSSVQVLDLSKTELRDITDAAFQNLQQMVELILSHNKLSALTSNTFKGLRMDGYDYPLKSLKTLRLDHNMFKSLHPDSFQHIDRGLENLYLNNNPFYAIDDTTEEALNSLVKLKVLDLSNTGLKKLTKHFLFTPLHLKHLNLAHNLIENVTDLDLEEAHALEILNLNGNSISNITKQTGFPTVKTLRVLHLSKMDKLVEVGEHSLSNLVSLEELYLSNNPHLEKIHHEAMIRFENGSEVPVVTKLRKLYISNNNLSHLELQLDWENLVDLDIGGNEWACECHNQWLLDVLMIIYEKMHPNESRELKCASPVEMEGRFLHDLSGNHSLIRCLDKFGNMPEKDGTLLVGLLLGCLLAITAVLFVMYSYQRRWFGMFDQSPAAFSRQFYGRTKGADDDDMF